MQHEGEKQLQKAPHLSCLTVKQSGQRLLFLHLPPCEAGLGTSLTMDVFFYYPILHLIDLLCSSLSRNNLLIENNNV